MYHGNDMFFSMITKQEFVVASYMTSRQAQVCEVYLYFKFPICFKYKVTHITFIAIDGDN